MKSKWGSVEVERPNKDVKVSFTRGDEAAMRMIAKWFGMSYEEFLKIIPEKDTLSNIPNFGQQE